MKKLNSTIISASCFEFTDSKTGEIKSMTKINYLAEREDTDNFIGNEIKICRKMGNFIPQLKKVIGKPVVLGIDERNTEDGVKYVIKTVDNVEL